MARITARNGKLYLDGKQLIVGGINLYNRNGAEKVAALFPHASIVRCATPTIDALNDPSHWDSVIGPATAAGRICVIEMHDWVQRPDGSEGPPDAYSGADLARVAAGYKAQARKWKDNGLVIFESPNEPQNGDLTAEHQAVYDAIRSVSDVAIGFQGGRGGGNPGAVGAAVLNVAAYKAMRNVFMTIHAYGWPNGYTTDQNSVTATLMGNAQNTGILALRAMSSADGLMAVLISETGCSTNGQNRDANWQQVMTAGVGAVLNESAAGIEFWCWDADAVNALQQGGGASLSDWGNVVTGQLEKIAAFAATKSGTPGQTSAPSQPASADNTVITAGGTITDAAGNAWTISPTGQVVVNDQADGTTRQVNRMAFSGGRVWQENAAGLSWSKGQPADAWAPPAGTSWPIPAGTAPPATKPPTTTPPVTQAPAMSAAARAELGVIRDRINALLGS